MQLDPELVRQLKYLAAAKGDVLEAIMAEHLRGRGFDADTAQRAARECSNRIWLNSIGTGAAATLILSALYTPVVGGIAGPSLGAIVGVHTYLTSPSCAVVRDDQLHDAVLSLFSGN